MFGGCGLGAAVSAMEAVCDRPVVWATAQYLSFAMVGEIMDLDVTVAVAGKRTSQARAVGRVGDREILTVNAALGSKDIKIDEQWRTMPEVPNPQDCPLRSDMVADSESIMGRLNIRWQSCTTGAFGAVGADSRHRHVCCRSGNSGRLFALWDCPGNGSMGAIEQFG